MIKNKLSNRSGSAATEPYPYKKGTYFFLKAIANTEN